MIPTHPSRRRAYWLKTLHQWHWMSSAISLIGLILFAGTGVTLNNAAWLESRPTVTTRHATLPGSLLKQLAPLPATRKTALPVQTEAWLDKHLNIRINARTAEFSSDEIYVSLPEPGGDAWLSIDRKTGVVEYEHSGRGWVAYLNDLHKGRNTGAVWGWFIDLFGVACLLFGLTGLLLLKLHAKNRAATWPMVGLGLALPAALLVIFGH